MSVEKPLTGVKVVDLTYYVAGPGAARMLADWGADVIKVEPPTGDPNRTGGVSLGAPVTDDINPFFCTWNVNKRGIALDLKSEGGKAVMEKLLAEANIFVTSFRPNALKKLGLDYEAMSARHPHIIWASLNGYGDLGPIKDNPGFDMVAYWARSGAMLDLMEKDSAPIIPPLGFGDSVASGSLTAGICAALYQQKVTGKGTCVGISLLSQGVWNMAALVCSKGYGPEYPKSRKTPNTPLVNSYKTKDNEWIFITMFDNKVVPKLYHALELDHLMEDDRFNSVSAAAAHVAELTPLLEQAFAKLTLEQAIQKMTEADVAHGALYHGYDVPDDPQVLANNYVISYQHRNGEHSPMAMTPITFGGSVEREIRHPSPLLGEDTMEVMKELGYTADEIAALEAAGAIVVRK